MLLANVAGGRGNGGDAGSHDHRAPMCLILCFLVESS